MQYVLFVILFTQVDTTNYDTLASCESAGAAVITNLFDGTIPDWAMVECHIFTK